MYSVNMILQFIWDDEKNRQNIRKHHVSFAEAKTIFFNHPLEIYYDPDHSQEEDRYIAVGVSNKGRVLLVVHCENIKGSEIRIISARKGTKKEAGNFFKGKAT